MATYTVKVQDYDGENKFEINSLRQRVVDAAAGEEIIFDQSDASNAGHPLKIALYPDGAHLGGGSEYTAGVTIEGTPGQAGAKTKFTVSDANLHGTYFYYCESHRYMGGMIHYGDDSIRQDETVPAKYRLIDEGATAFDAQEGDLTSSIKKIVEEYDASLDPEYPWRLRAEIPTPHSNPWAVINTDTRNTTQYKITYNVQDSLQEDAIPRAKFINIDNAGPNLPEAYMSFILDRNPDANFEGYTYDDNHYVVSYTAGVIHPEANMWRGAGVHNITAYCYGSEGDSITLPSNFFAHTHILSDRGGPINLLEDQTQAFIDLFNEDILSSYRKVAYSNLIMGSFPRMLMYQVAYQVMVRQYLDAWDTDPPGTWSFSEDGAVVNNSTNFGSYDHAKFYAVGDPMGYMSNLFNDSDIFLGEYWAKDNAVIAAGYGGDLTRYEFDHGATANHADLIQNFVNSKHLSQYTDSSDELYNYIDLESIAIYPIKKIQ